MNQKQKEMPTGDTAGSVVSRLADTVNPIIPHVTVLQEQIDVLYFKRGIGVTPLHGKRPFLPSWPEHPIKTIEEMQAFDVEGWGAICGEASGIVVIDVDAAHDEGMKLADDWLERGLVDTFTVRTGGGGWHFYFAYLDGLKNAVGGSKGIPGVDIRTNGGQVVCAGSQHPNGRLYTVARHGKIAPMPDELQTLLRENGYFKDPVIPAALMPSREEREKGRIVSAPSGLSHAEVALSNEVMAVASAPEGTRNATLNTAAFNLGQLIGAGALERSRVENELRQAARSAGLPEPEIQVTLRSGIEAGIKEPRDLSNVGKGKRASKGIGNEATGNSDGGRPSRAPSSASDADSKRKNHPDDIEAFLASRWSFAMNELLERVEVDGQPIADTTVSVINNACRREGFTNTNVIADCIVELARENMYHPMKRYFSSLPAGNGETLERVLGCLKPMQDYDAAALKAFVTRWLIGVVSKVFDGSQNFVLVLDGAQGIGKSRFAHWVCPSLENDVAGSKSLFVSAGINMRTQKEVDEAMNAVTKMIQEIPEIGHTTSVTAHDFMKHKVSQVVTTFRIPYARYPLTRPVTLSYIGTINNEAGFLHDPTGNRRFAIVALEEIDWTVFDIDVDALWADVYALYQAGETPFLTAEEQAMQTAINEGYQRVPDVLTFIQMSVDVTGDPADFIPSIELAQQVQFAAERFAQTPATGKALGMQIASCMVLLGARKTRRAVSLDGKDIFAHGWAGVRLK